MRQNSVGVIEHMCYYAKSYGKEEGYETIKVSSGNSAMGPGGPYHYFGHGQAPE